MPTTHALLPAVATWVLTNPWSTHTTPSQVWLSHPSLEYAHLCLCQLWLRGYLTYPWSTHTTPSQVWLSHPSLEYAHHAHTSASAATWLSHLSLEYAHHAQPGVAISPIPGVRPPRPALCLCQLWLCGYLTHPWSTHTTPSQVWLSHPSLNYAHHARFSASSSCSYMAISLIPGSCPPRPPFYQLWLCGFSSIPGVRTPCPARCVYLTYPWSRPTTPTLCQLWLRGWRNCYRVWGHCCDTTDSQMSPQPRRSRGCGDIWESVVSQPWPKNEVSISILSWYHKINFKLVDVVKPNCFSAAQV